ncbi:glycoside hydrolase family 26 protein [Streptomyces collinus]|uniref:glycoside hydrolase family 26 protein n=1 Tax=Streptomyces collinus TaxID=42684 RepID=UPI0029433F82|nr:glycosyl hydrolase [Streptomyces collinus]
MTAGHAARFVAVPMLTLGLLLTGCVSGQSQSAKPVDDSVRRITAPQGRYFGVSTLQAPWSRAETATVAQKAGSAPNMLEYFVKWTENFRPAAVRASYAQGAVPLLTWEPWAGSGAGTRQSRYALARIAGGGFDAYVTRFAEAVHAQGRPVVIRFAHEMNGTWFPWSEQRNGNHKGEYVKAWRHVHDLFEQAGADNVIWLWSPNVVRDAPAVSLRELYPGDAYVSLVGMTGYQDDESTAGAVFDTTLARLRGLTDRPVVIAETGARPGRKKAAWIAAFFRWFVAHREVIGFVWFERSCADGGHQDWRFTQTPGTTRAFAGGLGTVRLARITRS